MGDNIEQPVVLPIREALRLAQEQELDLIEISPKAEPPVCRIADYQKFLYQQKKTYALTFEPSLRKFMACLSLKL